MKISIILGVLHMLFGVCLSFWNHRYFQKPLNIYTEFIPQILFLCCMFGYLSLMMFIKWSKYYANGDPNNFALSERCAPSILITFINMVLFRGSEAEKDCDAFMYGGQRGFQGSIL
jgi:V-type H+-transporting ATPase subunit a